MLRVDLPTLSGAAELCGAQADHVGEIKSYVSTVCDQSGAFQGVLTLFKGTYGKAVTAAISGLQSSVQIGDKMRSELRGVREDFLDADLAAYKAMRTVCEDLGGVPPYVVPGAGGYVPGGPPPGRAPGGDEELDGLDGWDAFAASRDGLMRDTQRETDQPDWAKSHKDRFGDWWDERTHKDADERRVDENATRRQHDEARDAGERARDEAKNDGASRREARDAGKEERRETSADQREGNRHRDNAAGGGAVVNDLYNEAQDLRDNINDLREHDDNVRENERQRDRLDRFRDRDEDEELREWGSR